MKTKIIIWSIYAVWSIAWTAYCFRGFRRIQKIRRDFDRNDRAFAEAAKNRNITAMKSLNEQCEASLEELKKL